MPFPEEQFEDPEPFSIEDEKFDQVFAPRVRNLSAIFWTPVAVAAEAATLLVDRREMRVLDIGCGPGKFCLIGASLTAARFTGVEQRAALVEAATEAARAMNISNVEFLHANITDVDFGKYDGFYLFNPFEENMHGYQIDSSVPLSPALFKRYARHVAGQLGERPLGTRIVTYMGYADEIPDCYSCEATRFGNDLKLWIKTREYDPEIERLELGGARAYRGSAGWVAPRQR